MNTLNYIEEVRIPPARRVEGAYKEAHPVKKKSPKQEGLGI